MGRRGGWRAAGLLLLLLRAAGGDALRDEAEAAPPGNSRPYAVLQTQNLVLMGSVFGILLVAMILLSVCVYKPIRRR
ncbi:uncharacterized protein C12orf76 homolog [Podarcis raffonei]|uniref:uncharacterized protein C12orf76 homolog n=1 Tax=Podarcis raffonei TaxID=65483 RepID=UPI0023292BCE|nr:uncharacterized protein C12orf76 homolog [Podarcis raffonei]